MVPPSRAVNRLTMTVVSVVAVACLYWAQAVLIPISLAIFFTFLLRPMVIALQRLRLGRIGSVLAVTFAVALVTVGTGWIVTTQAMTLVGELPGYTDNLKNKVRSIQELASGTVASDVSKMVKDVSEELKARPPANTDKEIAKEPVKVVVEPESIPWLSKLPSQLTSVLDPLGTTGLVLILTLFMLLNSEDLRDRFIKLVGRGRITLTTRAVDDAGQRISRYLRMQLVVNSTYGLALGIGLYFIDVDYAILWGFLAGVLRYVPYIGPWIAAVFPLAFSLAKFPGWTEPLLVLGLIVVLELVSNNVIEPWLYGHSIGVSPVGFLVSAAFWTFLWGPVGLVLSGPLTVCLVVLGKYVPSFRFFHTLLGDQPPLQPDESFYQRLLARDQDEAAEIAHAFVQKSPPEDVYDGLLVPALGYATHDQELGNINDEDVDFIHRAVAEIIEELGEVLQKVDANAAEADASERVRILGCPARGEADRLSLEMLGRLLDPRKCELIVVGTDVLAAELIPLIDKSDAAAVCIGSLAPGGLAHTRYLCKRLLVRLPNTKCLVGRWGLKDGPADIRLSDSDKVPVARTLLEARTQLEALLPALVEGQALAETFARG